MEDIITYADDNYDRESNDNLQMAIAGAKKKNGEHKSGLKINVHKTEICIFHRRNLLTREVDVNSINIIAKCNFLLHYLAARPARQTLQ